MSWQRRMADLSKRIGQPHPPLFAPLARTVACQIEAISPQEMIVDPVRLQKGIGELRRAARLDILVPAAPSGLEAEALGATLDFSVWPPRLASPANADFAIVDDFDAAWTRSAGLSASLEATARLAPEIGDDNVIVAGLTGPATLLRQLTGGNRKVSADEMEFVTRALAALVRRFGQAGAGVIVFVESVALPPLWEELFGTIGNTAKFLKLPVSIALQNIDTPTEWPRSALRPEGLSGTGASAMALDADPSNWGANAPIGPDTRIVTTAGEVPADLPLGVLLDQIGLAKAQSVRS